MILKKGKSCIIEIIIFLFRYKNFAIHGKQIGVSVVHEIPFGGAQYPDRQMSVGRYTMLASIFIVLFVQY